MDRKIIRISTLALLAFSLVFVFGNFSSGGEVLGAVSSSTDFSKNKVQLVTKTAFEQSEIFEAKPIPFDIKYEEDSSAEYGTEQIIRVGKDGKKVFKYLLTHWRGEEIDRKLLSTEVTDPVSQIVSKGTKIVWRTINVEGNEVKYWYKLRVWATKYDANCEGCWGRTYTGTEVKKGVCAVDPKVIKLGTRFYVEGYGFCRAEDIGGGIKGNEVDLGFMDAAKGAWGAAYTNIYLLDNQPY